MCNSNLQCNLWGSGNGCGISWIGDVSDTQNPQRMLLVDIQCLIMHITGHLFKCERLGVISAIFEVQFTNHTWESCFEFLQKHGPWPFAKLLNSPRRIANLHGVYGCRGHSLQHNIYCVGVKVGATRGISQWLTLPNGLWCTIDVF